MKKNTRFSTCSLFIAGLLAGLCLVSCSPEPKKTQEPIVKTTYGSISGSLEDGVFSFKGIPYAKAERFMPPQAPDAWEGVRDSTKFGPIAMQVNSWSPETAMNEEKLFTVNVWTQGLNDGKKRPVMFWLHGGGFAVGASDDPITDGKILAQKGDIVLVSVNHRLNILGFRRLATSTQILPVSACWML
jgi:para-nitrobenzyl esterase